MCLFIDVVNLVTVNPQRGHEFILNLHIIQSRQNSCSLFIFSFLFRGHMTVARSVRTKPPVRAPIAFGTKVATRFVGIGNTIRIYIGTRTWTRTRRGWCRCCSTRIQSVTSALRICYAGTCFVGIRSSWFGTFCIGKRILQNILAVG